MDHAELLIPSQIHRGNKDEPYGVLTELGWVVRGKAPRVNPLSNGRRDTFRHPIQEKYGTEGAESKLQTLSEYDRYAQDMVD